MVARRDTARPTASTAAEVAPLTASVRLGVFFGPPETLPRGRHRMTREQIAAAQRERLMIAITELLAQHGWAHVRVSDIAARAGVSLEAFYSSFTDKESCIFAAYERFINVLVERVGESASTTLSWRDFISGELEAYLGTLMSDLVVARAFQVEFDALGRQARMRRRASLLRFAEVSFGAQERLLASDPGLRGLSIEAHLAMVYAVRQLACDALETVERPDLRAMIPQLLEWILPAFYGAPAP